MPGTVIEVEESKQLDSEITIRVRETVCTSISVLI